MITKNLLVKIFFLMLFGNLFAQEMEKDSISTKILDEVIITATRSLRQMLFLQFQVKFWCLELMMVNMQKLKF